MSIGKTIKQYLDDERYEALVIHYADTKIGLNSYETVDFENELISLSTKKGLKIIPFSGISYIEVLTDAPTSGISFLK